LTEQSKQSEPTWIPSGTWAATLEQTVVAAKQLFEVDAAAIMLGDADGRVRWASASDPLAQALEDNQEAFASGPCLHTFASGQPAVIDDVRGDTVRRGDPAQVLLDLVYRLPSGGEGAAKVEQELWYGPHSRQQVLAPRPRS
jgi:hypothetical protein